ncbi:MAG TPA: hypothetical protein ENN69_04665 [Spirochaetia bacterium]|nr:hypothetical protein [Spirochaetia bacterium]
MKYNTATKKKLYLGAGLLVASGIAVVAVLAVSGAFATPAPEHQNLFYHALKINGEYVPNGVFTTEWKNFYERHKRNARTLRLNQEERTDLFFEQVIDRMALQEYVYSRAGDAASDERVAAYIEENIGSLYTTREEFNQYLSAEALAGEEDLEREVKFYLARLAVLPDIAREKGITLTEAEIEQGKSGKMSRDALLMQKFLRSPEFVQWTAELRKNVTVEILSPAILAFRSFQDGNYNEAARLYREAYQRYGVDEFLEKARESDRLAK